MIQSFEYKRANSIKELIEHTTECNLLFLAGGTDLVPNLKYEIRSADTLVDLCFVQDLNRIIQDTDGTLRLGSMVTLKQLMTSDLVNQLFPELSHAASRVASPQIRNIGTLGGNLMQDRRCIYFNQNYNWRSNFDACYKTGGVVCHQGLKSDICRATYYSDIATILYVLHAKVSCIVNGKIKVLSIEELIQYHSNLNGRSSCEQLLITEVILPPRKGNGFFLKEAVRNAIDFPLFNAAGSVEFFENGEISRFTIAVGAISPYPQYLTSTSDAMLVARKGNRVMTEDLIVELTNIVFDEISKNTILILEDNITIKVKRQLFSTIYPKLFDLYKKSFM